VNAATHRTDVEYVWPQTLVRPSRDVRLVYLDQAQWIYLAQAATGHPLGGQHVASLEALRSLKADGSILCPLSLTHLMETSAITPRQREDLASLMEELSDFFCLLPRSAVMLMELEAVLDEIRPRARGYAPVPLIGKGTTFAVGKTGRFNMYDGDGRMVTDEVRASFPTGPAEFDCVMDQAYVELDRAVLRGPKDTAEEVQLTSYGWKPRLAMTIGDQKAQQEQEQAARFSDKTLIPDDPTDYRRERVREDMREEIIPKNILMIGPTGVGKTEIARRLAGLAGAPFVKVEATKYTEVGYVGRDVESMVRDLVEHAVRMVQEERREDVKEAAARAAVERIIDALHPETRPPSAQGQSNNFAATLGNIFGGSFNQGQAATQTAAPSTPAAPADDVAKIRDQARSDVQRGFYDVRLIEIDVEESPSMNIGVIGGMDPSMGGADLGDMLGGLLPKKHSKKRVTVQEARRIFEQEEAAKLIDMDAVKREAVRRAGENGIIFSYEIDKVAGREGGRGPDVSREGVQRDILPIV